MASKPTKRNVIEVKDFSSLKNVEEEVIDTSCNDRKYT